MSTIGGMTLLDAVRVNCKIGATAENQGEVPGIWAKVWCV